VEILWHRVVVVW